MEFKTRTKQRTGLFKGEIILLNPTLSELEDKGIRKSKTQQYKYEKDGKESLKLSFYIKSNLGIHELSFFLRKEFSVAKSGKVECINDFGEHRYFDSLDDAKKDEKFSHNETLNIRRAIVGETTLNDFLLKWINIDRNYEYSVLLDFKRLFSEDYYELSDLIGKDVNPVVFVMYIDNGFERVYNREFLQYYYWDKLSNDILGYINTIDKNGKLEQIDRFLIKITDKDYGVLKPEEVVKL